MMKQVIKVKVLNPKCTPKVREDSDWIDLRAAESYKFCGPYATTKSKKGGDTTRQVVMPWQYIPLGVIIQIPEGMEAIIVPRSSSIKNFHFIQPNSIGIIDSTYCGPKDQLFYPVLNVGKVEINEEDRICQLRIQLSQKATMWQKIKWLLSSGVKIEIVDDIKKPSRGGLGHSGRR